MDLASTYYLGVTLLLFAVFAAIVAFTYHPRREEQGERAKYRMMEEGEPRQLSAAEKSEGGER